MNFSDSFFKKVEKKTSVDKNSIMNLAAKLQKGDLKDKENLESLIDEIGAMTGKEVTQNQKNKIVETIVGDKLPDNLDKMF